MLTLIIASLYFILPTYLANMCPVIAGKLNLPLGKPISTKKFGSHKTWRGFYSGYIGAFTVLVIQYMLHQQGNFLEYSLIEYSELNIFLYALLFSLGAVAGDIVKSFFKRKVKIKAGAPWIPFDQIDLIIGSYIFLFPVFIMPWQTLLTLLVITPFLHFLANLLAYAFRLKKVWW